MPSKIDDLDYSYVGNKLTSIDDTSMDGNGYEGGGSTIDYDINGNMINMLDKGINSIAYNHLNLPDAMDMGSGKRKSSTSNIYRADGAKLKKIHTSNGPGISNTWVTTVSTTDYLDGFQYVQKTPSGNGLTGEGLDTDNELELAMEREAFRKEDTVDPLVEPGGGTTAENFVLQFVPTAEGYYSFTENRYIYQYKDHLGNARVSFARNNTSGAIEVTDKNDYYPFGMNHLNSEAGAYFGQGSYKNYKYNGKELQETGMYDYGARFYMPDIGRWGVVDPLAETSRRWSTYTYVYNNPLRFIDPDGRQGTDIFKWDNAGKLTNVAPSERDVIYTENQFEKGSNTLKEGAQGIDVGEKGTVAANMQEVKLDSPITDPNGNTSDTMTTLKLNDSGKALELAEYMYKNNNSIEFANGSYTSSNGESKSVISTFGLGATSPIDPRHLGMDAFSNNDIFRLSKHDHNHPGNTLPSAYMLRDGKLIPRSSFMDGSKGYFDYHNTISVNYKDVKFRVYTKGKYINYNSEEAYE